MIQTLVLTHSGGDKRHICLLCDCYTSAFAVIYYLALGINVHNNNMTSLRWARLTAASMAIGSRSNLGRRMQRRGTHLERYARFFSRVRHSHQALNVFLAARTKIRLASCPSSVPQLFILFFHAFSTKHVTCFVSFSVSQRNWAAVPDIDHRRWVTYLVGQVSVVIISLIVVKLVDNLSE